MAVSLFPPVSSGGAGGSEFITFSAPAANTYYAITQNFNAGIYRFRSEVVANYRVIFYSGATIVASFGPLSASTALTLPSNATTVRFSSTVANGLFGISASPISAPAAANINIQTITTSGQVTLSNSALVVALGGGGGGGNGGNGAGSGYLAQGVLGAGTYNVVIGAGAGPDGTGGTTSIGNLSAAGGFTNTIGGTSGTGDSSFVGWVDGQGPGGSGIRISESLVSPGISWQTAGAGPGSSAGVYAGGTRSGSTGNSAVGFGGGGTGSTYGNNVNNRPGGSGFQGVVWIGTLN